LVCSEDSAVPSEGVKKGPFHRRDAENAEKYAEKTGFLSHPLRDEDRDRFHIATAVDGIRDRFDVAF
jgi:hypothetical protein